MQTKIFLYFRSLLPVLFNMETKIHTADDFMLEFANKAIDVVSERLCLSDEEKADFRKRVRENNRLLEGLGTFPDWLNSQTAPGNWRTQQPRKCSFGDCPDPEGTVQGWGKRIVLCDFCGHHVCVTHHCHVLEGEDRVYGCGHDAEGNKNPNILVSYQCTECFLK